MPALHQVPGSQSASPVQFPPAALRHSSDPQVGVDDVSAQRPLRHWLSAVHACWLLSTQMVLGSQNAGEVQVLPEQQAWLGAPHAKALAGTVRTALKTRIVRNIKHLVMVGSLFA